MKPSVENNLKAICKKNVIEYIDKEKLPFKGKPDNTIKINDEFVIFDAKSPERDELNNFGKYIKIQTESVKKYIKEPGVKKDIYLVVPSEYSRGVRPVCIQHGRLQCICSYHGRAGTRLSCA
jgi:predicted nucleotidyltransferase